jgi:hypothetical protein
VEAQNASIEEILTALSQQFNFRYHSSANIETQVTGTYRGPMRRVLTRILGGRDFIVKSSNGLMEVTVLEKGPTVSATAQAPAASQISPNPQALRNWLQRLPRSVTKLATRHRTWLQHPPHSTGIEAGGRPCAGADAGIIRVTVAGADAGTLGVIAAGATPWLSSFCARSCT